MFKNTGIYHTPKLDFSFANISKTNKISRLEEKELGIKTATDNDVSSMTNKDNKIKKDSEEQDDKIKTLSIEIKKTEIVNSPKTSDTGAKESTENAMTPDMLREVVPETTVTDKEKQVAVSTAIVNEVKDDLTIPEATHPTPVAHDAAVMDTSEHTTEYTTSLLIPILSLSLVVLIILVLGSVRGFYIRYVKTTQGQHRSRSTTSRQQQEQ